jgi:hypothetical protein
MVYRVLVSTRRGWQEVWCTCAAARACFLDPDEAERAAEQHRRCCRLFGSAMAYRVAATELIE